MRVKYLLLAGVAMVMFVKTYSQSDCEKILQYGIYNEIKKTSQSNNYKQEIQNSCNQLDQAIAKSEGGGGGISFAGFGLSGTYSKQELLSIKKMYCESRISTETADKIIQENSRIISSEVLDAYLKCREITSNKNIQLRIAATNEDFSQVKISIVGNFPNPRLAPTFQKMDIDTAVFQIINDDLFKASIRGDTLNRHFTIFLKRKLTDENIARLVSNSLGKRKIISEESLIGINLVDQSLVIKIPEISKWLEPVYVKSPLIGQVIASLLDSTSFFQAFDKDEWMLANGGNVPQSASYFRTLYGDTVPDLRGIFLRGKNYSRSDEFRNADGDVMNGTPQMEEYKEHDHNFSKPLTFPTGGGAYSLCNGCQNYGLPVRPENEFTLKKTEVKGGNETRPKNVTVSYYIRIRVKDNNN